MAVYIRKDAEVAWREAEREAERVVVNDRGGLHAKNEVWVVGAP